MKFVYTIQSIIKQSVNMACIRKLWNIVIVFKGYNGKSNFPNWCINGRAYSGARNGGVCLLKSHTAFDVNIKQVCLTVGSFYITCVVNQHMCVANLLIEVVWLWRGEQEIIAWLVNGIV